MTSLTNICHTYHIYLKDRRPQISAAPSQQQCEGYLLSLLDTLKLKIVVMIRCCCCCFFLKGGSCFKLS